MFFREFLCAMISLLSVWGAAALVYMLSLWLIRPKTGENAVVLLRMSGAPETDIARVSYCLSRLNVTGELRFTVIAAVYAEEDETDLSYSAVKKAFAQEPRVLVCSASRFIDVFLA
jgi:hypothetical protein